MANMKDLLGDMDFEEFEVMRKSVLQKMKRANWKLLTESDNETKTIYNYWLEIGGKELIKNWVNDHGSHMTEVRVLEGISYIVGAFISWLESFE
jgi:hypothetical protein